MSRRARLQRSGARRRFRRAFWGFWRARIESLIRGDDHPEPARYEIGADGRISIWATLPIRYVSIRGTIAV